MRYFAGIKLPIQRVEKIRGEDIDIIDHIIDMKVPDMNKLLALLHQQDIPSMAVISHRELKLVALFFYRPPDIFLDVDAQGDIIYRKYQLYLAPSFPLLIHYWTDRRMRTHDLYESQMITKVIIYLEEHLKKIQNPSVSHT